MTIETALYAYLTGYAGITALVGTRVFPMLLPQTPMYPALTYQRISGARTHGNSGTPILARPRYQIDCYATTYAGVKALSEQVRLAMDGHKAATGVWASILVNDVDDYESITGIYRAIIDVLLWQVE